MNNNNIDSGNLTFTVNLAIEAHSIARYLSQGIANEEKAKQVSHNSLAVYALDYYLNCLGFETDWPNSHSHNSLDVTLMDVADLIVTDMGEYIGKLECRPVLQGAEYLEIPYDVWEERIGYVAIQLDSDLRQAEIIGYTKEPRERVNLNDLLSLENFIYDLTDRTVVRLRKWLEGIFNAEWQSVEQLSIPETFNVSSKSRRSPNLAFRGFRFKNGESRTKTKSIIRSQEIDLGLEELSLVLVVDIISEEGKDLDILIQVIALENLLLPEGTKIIIQDELGSPDLEVISSGKDNCIECNFAAELGEKFQVTVSYKDSKKTINFES